MAKLLFEIRAAIKSLIVELIVMVKQLAEIPEGINYTTAKLILMVKQLVKQNKQREI
jgi:hypothetical protein